MARPPRTPQPQTPPPGEPGPPLDPEAPPVPETEPEAPAQLRTYRALAPLPYPDGSGVIARGGLFQALPDDPRVLSGQAREHQPEVEAPTPEQAALLAAAAHGIAGDQKGAGLAGVAAAREVQQSQSPAVPPEGQGEPQGAGSEAPGAPA